MSLFLYSLPVMSGDFGEFAYGDFKEVSQEAVQATKALSETLSEIVSDNPMIMPVSGIAALAAMLFFKRDDIRKQYDATLNDVKEKKEGVERNLPFPVKMGINTAKWVFLCGIKPITGSASTYLKHNKWHLLFSTASIASGYALAYQMTGAFLAATISTVGYMRQGYYELQEEMSEARKENKELHGKTQQKVIEVQKSIDEINKKTTELLNRVDRAEKQIVGKFDELGAFVEKKNQQVVEKMEESKAELKRDIQGIGAGLEKLNGELKDVPKNILDLRKELVSVIHQNKEVIGLNNELVANTKDLREKISNALDLFVSTQEKLDKLGMRFTLEMKNLDQKIEAVGQKVEKLDQKIDDKFEAQKDDLQKFTTEIQDKNEVQLSLLKEGFDKKLEGVSETFSILTDLSKGIKEAQESRDAQIAQLLNDSQEGKAVSGEMREMINKIMHTQSTSANANAQMLKDINEIRQTSSDTAAEILPKIGTINERLAKVSEDIAALKEQLENERKKRKKLKKVIYGMADTVTNLSVQNTELIAKMSNLEKATAEINRTTTQTHAIAQNAVKNPSPGLEGDKYNNPDFVVHLDRQTNWPKKPAQITW